MLVAILDLRTTATDRSAALAQLESEREGIRNMPGNLDFRVYAARENEEAVVVIHGVGRRAVVRHLPGI